MVTVGPVASYKTLLSVDVDALLALPIVSVTTPAPMLGTNVPAPVTAVADNVHVILSDVDKLQVIPVAVPPCAISPVVKVAGAIASLNTIVKFIGIEFVGSACAIACS